MRLRLLALVALTAVTVAACGSTAVQTVTAGEAADLLADPPPDLVVLDVRTPAEFAQGHLEGAVLVDYNAPDFAERVGQLDRDVPYLLYCRTGNRSAGAREVMADLGFTEIYEMGGGIVSWAEAGLPIVTG